MAKQLNIFVENRPGRLEAISNNLTKSQINVRAFMIQDRGDFGLMKLIVDNPDKAYLAMADLGCACALKEVLAIRIPDKSGNLHRLTMALAQAKINILDAYGFVIQPNNVGICCMEIESLQLSGASEIVRDAGFEILEDEQLYEI